MSLDRTKLCHQLIIKNKIQETNDTVSLEFEISSALKEKFKYRAGQFVTFFLDIDGAEVHRSYSLASSPDADQNFKVAVKLVPGGRGSTLLVQKVNVGDTLWATPPAGQFCLPSPFTAKAVGFFAAGSGITPIISLLKTALKTTGVPCALFYQSKNENQIIFKNELAELEKKYSGRLKVTHILSQPSSGWVGLKGRAQKNDAREFFVRTALGSSSIHYLCGPTEFMQTIKLALEDVGLDKAKIHIENFSTPTQDAATRGAAASAPTPSDKSADALPAFDGDEVWIGDRATRGAPKTVEAIIDGESHSIQYKDNATILETLLEAGLNPPYSCMDGACMACIGKIENGLAYQNEPGILSDDNVEANECLTCQARPASKNIKINYGHL